MTQLESIYDNTIPSLNIRAEPSISIFSLLSICWLLMTVDNLIILVDYVIGGRSANKVAQNGRNNCFAEAGDMVSVLSMAIHHSKNLKASYSSYLSLYKVIVLVDFWHSRANFRIDANLVYYAI